MQQFFEQNQKLITTIITLLVGGVLSAIVRAVPGNTWWLQILRAILQSGNSLENHVAAKADAITSQADGSRVVKLTLASLALLLGAFACASTQFVSATASNGDQFPYCLEAKFKLNPLQADTLFCAGLSEIQAEQIKQSALHPDVTYTVVKQSQVAK